MVITDSTDRSLPTGVVLGGNRSRVDGNLRHLLNQCAGYIRIVSSEM
jgi:hypothetical protein